MFRYIVVCITALAMVGQYPTAVVSVAQSATPGFEEKRTIVRESIALLDELRRQIDRAQLDLDALSEELEYDAETIVDFVTNNIDFEQYSGVLRGARGTLIANAGNALDQALLLATLLRDAGYDARIARAELTREDASLLLEEMQRPRRPNQPIFANEKKAEEILRKLSIHVPISDDQIDALLGESPSAKEDATSTLAQAARGEVQFILNVLQRQSIEVGVLGTNDGLIEEAADYFFVEMRDQAQSRWMPIHPSLTSGASFSGALNVTAYYDEAIPGQLQHRFRFEVLLNRRAGNEVTTHSLFVLPELPVATMLGNPITYTNISLDMVSNPEETLNSPPADGVDMFLPVIDTSTQSDAFDLRGNIVPADAALSPYAALFQTTSENVQKATEALFGLGSGERDKEKPLLRLENIHIKYSLISPTGQQRDYIRTVYDADLASQAENRYLEAVQQLTKVYSVSVGVGAVSPTYALDRQLEEAVAKGPQLDALFAYWGGDVSEQETRSRLKGEFRHGWSGHALLELLLQSVPWSNDDVISYIPGPTIVVHHREMPIARDAIETVDIVTRPRATYASSTLEPAFQANLFVGVWETFTEGALTLANSVGGAWGAKATFDEARSKNQKFVVLQPSHLGELAELDLPGLVHENILRDLRDGYVLILPDPRIRHTDVRAYNWWRINPESGSALGVSGSGEGQAASEYVMATVVISLFTMACVATVPAMRRDPNNPRPPRESIRTIERCAGVSTSVTGFALSFPLLSAMGLIAAIGFLYSSE